MRGQADNVSEGQLLGEYVVAIYVSLVIDLSNRWYFIPVADMFVLLDGVQ